MAEELTVESFKINTNGHEEYYAILCVDGFDAYEQTLLLRAAFQCEIAGKKYVRVGEKIPGVGTKTQLEEFQPYFDKHGPELLRQDQYSQLLADNHGDDLITEDEWAQLVMENPTFDEEGVV